MNEYTYTENLSDLTHAPKHPNLNIKINLYVCMMYLHLKTLEMCILAYRSHG